MHGKKIESVSSHVSIVFGSVFTFQYLLTPGDLRTNFFRQVNIVTRNGINKKSKIITRGHVNVLFAASLSHDIKCIPGEVSEKCSFCLYFSVKNATFLKEDKT